MIERRLDGLYVVELDDEDLLRVPDVLSVLRNNNVFDTRSLFRTVSGGKLNTIVEFGIDRNKDMAFEEACESVVALKWNNNMELCHSCRETNKLEGVTVIYGIFGDYEMRIKCPYYREKGFMDAPPESNYFCPFYMSIESGSRVLYAKESYHSYPDNSDITDEVILASDIETMNKPGKTGSCYKNILVYEHSKLKPFDLERYIFCEGVRPKEALKAVLTSEKA